MGWKRSKFQKNFGRGQGHLGIRNKGILVTFRYDQAFEFLEAIRQQRIAHVFWDGARATGHGRGSGFLPTEARWVHLD